MTVAEVGVWEGSTVAAYLDTVKKNNGTIYAVDWFLGSLINSVEIQEWQAMSRVAPGSWNPDNFEVNLKAFKDRINNDPCVKILAGDSVEMAEDIPDESLDICCIDASHRYTQVLKDIGAYLPKIKSGGIICGHDCECTWDQVTLVLEKHMKHKDDLDRETGVPYFHLGVIKAVYDVFERWKSDGLMWLVNITDENRQGYIKSVNDCISGNMWERFRI